MHALVVTLACTLCAGLAAASQAVIGATEPAPASLAPRAAPRATGGSSPAYSPDALLWPVTPTAARAQGGASARAVLSGPDPDQVIRGAKTPYTWVRGHRRVLLVYSKAPRAWWPGNDIGPYAVSLVNSQGHVLSRWAPPTTWDSLTWSAAGRGFVGITTYAPRAHPVFVNAGGVTALTWVRGKRHHRVGDIRFGDGLLLNLTTRTVTTERLPGATCSGAVTIDLRGRVWCLDRAKRTISWTDDRTRWSHHRLSTSYHWYCDGGTLGAEISIVGRNVVVGLWSADFSTDRGRTWHVVDLPFTMVGARHATASSEADCTFVSLLRDGRIHIAYFDDAVAVSAANTHYRMLKPPRGAVIQYPRSADGVLVAAMSRQYGRRVVSYDGGARWRPLRVPTLLRHIFTK